MLLLTQRTVSKTTVKFVTCEFLKTLYDLLEAYHFHYSMKNRYVKHNYLYCIRLFQWATCFDPIRGSSSAS